jgi:HD-like signal output (HDOD) protein
MTQHSTPPLHVCSTPDELVKQLRTLPPAPKVLMRLQPMLTDLNTDVDELAAVIRLERALAARILQVSNSVYAGLGSKVSSIEEAITIIGFREVRRLVALVIGAQILEKPLPAYGLDARGLWRQSIACGLAAEELAHHCDEDPNSAYTLGLLHSVGMVVVNGWATMVSKGRQLSSTGYPDDFTASERAMLGFTNAETGAALLRRWDFPASVVEPVRAQYEPLLANSHVKLAHLLNVCRWLRNAACETTPPTVMPDPRSLAALNVDEALVQGLLPVVIRRLEEADRLLETKSPA